MSFVAIGILWQNHHALFRLVQRVDRMTIFLNWGLLGVTAFIPFATATLGAYPKMALVDIPHGATLTWAVIAFNLLLMHGVRSAPFHPNVGRATVRLR